MIRAVRLPDAEPPQVVTDAGILRGYLEDASGAPPGRAAGMIRAGNEAEAATWLRRSLPSGRKVLFQAARTSLTGGAIPHDEVVLSVERMGEIGPIERCPGGARVVAEPGVRLEELQRHLEPRGWFFPPVPTYQQAMLGGAVSTNAGGAASFKYGVTRQWVRALRVLLFNGDLLEIERGEHRARPGDRFAVRLSDGAQLALPVPTYALPDIKKISAGYHAADPLDLIDLFIGAEGTLGMISAVTLELAPLPGSVVTGFAFVASSAAALRLAGDLRRAGLDRRESGDDGAPDVRAIEYLDEHCLALLREGGEARELRIAIPRGAGAALLFEAELEREMENETAQRILAGVLDGSGSDDPLARLFRILERHGAIDGLQFAFPADRERRRALADLREAAPTRVNELLAARRAAAPGIKKVGGDLIVPFEKLPEMMALYRRGFEERGLEYAVWGHLSDGNLHPNALPRSADEVALGFEALLEFASAAVRLGGCPLSEHGVGRNPVKQETLLRFLGRDALAQMRRIKGALDPAWRLAPGVLFPAPHPPDRPVR